MCDNIHVPADSWRWKRYADVRRMAERLCREEPLCFTGDKRGRAEELLISILTGKSAHARHAGEEGDLASWWYTPPRSERTSVPFIARRLAIPKKAAFVQVEGYLDQELREAFNRPDSKPPENEPPPRGFFRVDMTEWRSAARKMVRSGLAALLPACTTEPHLSAGAFCVRKSETEDRFIGDRRPQNFVERQVRKPFLPYAPRLRRLRLRPGEVALIYARDLRHCFYVYGVGEERLARQVIGPRIPRSWLTSLEEESWMACLMRTLRSGGAQA